MMFGQERLGISDGVLNREFMLRMQEIDVDKRALFYFCLGKRMYSFFLLVLLAYSSINIFFCTLFFGIQGFFIGSMMEILAIRYGGQGILVYANMVFPQGIFYGLGFLALGCWCLLLEKKQETGRRKKIDKIRSVNTIYKLWIALLLVLIGVIVESYDVGVKSLIKYF